MTSFIVIAKEKEKRINYAKDYCTRLNIDPFDITLIEKDTTKNTTSIGIEDVKNMQKKIFLKPIKSQTKAVLIDESHLLTTEAQNALLKVLEEPPMQTIIILMTESRENLLPTIISRCHIIELEERQIKLSEKELQEYETFIENLPSLTRGGKLKKAELLAKDKEKAIEWIKKLILVLREKLLKAPDTSDTLDTIRKLHSPHTLLKTTNVNTRFAFEHTLLTINEVE